MTIAVLQSMREVHASRREMRARGVSMLPPAWCSWVINRLPLSRFEYGDFVKSWDVWKTARFIEERLPRESSIIDLGAYRSEILPVLYRLGYTNLHGVDLNPRLARAPYRQKIHYTIGDFFASPYPSATFDAVTSISAIEHGHDSSRLLAEVARLLKPGGYFLCSTDYWPDKIDTSDHRIFDLPWTIFSTAEIHQLLADAQTRGLEPVGELALAAPQAVIHHAGKDYTFAWLALKRMN